jgi:hypothetical protein
MTPFWIFDVAVPAKNSRPNLPREIVSPRALARIIHVGWDEVAETIGGPSQANRLTNLTLL